MINILTYVSNIFIINNILTCETQFRPFPMLILRERRGRETELGFNMYCITILHYLIKKLYL